MPRPFAAYARDAFTVGSASKALWGGLRIGWVRAPLDQMERLTRARVTLDLGVPVMEQLALVYLLGQLDSVLAEHRSTLRQQRDALMAALAERLPDWTFRPPSGGLSLWCELPGRARGLALALVDEAQRQGVLVAPGPVFAPEGGLDRFVRVPYTRRVDELERSVDALVTAWDTVGARPSTAVRGTGRVMVA
jgi:DNA-binding transcriptional MocR family regulator